jgi:hypothetical protein
MGVRLAAVFGEALAALATGWLAHDQVSHRGRVAMHCGLTLVNFDRLLLLITVSERRLLAMVR